jgi:hypothetical protein
MIKCTLKIQAILSHYDLDEQKEILARAWDACCDGACLLGFGITEDLWDGAHENEREAAELTIVSTMIKIFDSGVTK